MATMSKTRTGPGVEFGPGERGQRQDPNIVEIVWGVGPVSTSIHVALLSVSHFKAEGCSLLTCCDSMNPGRMPRSSRNLRAHLVFQYSDSQRSVYTTFHLALRHCRWMLRRIHQSRSLVPDEQVSVLQPLRRGTMPYKTGNICAVQSISWVGTSADQHQDSFLAYTSNIFHPPACPG